MPVIPARKAEQRGVLGVRGQPGPHSKVLSQKSPKVLSRFLGIARTEKKMAILELISFFFQSRYPILLFIRIIGLSFKYYHEKQNPPMNYQGITCKWEYQAPVHQPLMVFYILFSNSKGYLLI